MSETMTNKYQDGDHSSKVFYQWKTRKSTAKDDSFLRTTKDWPCKCFNQSQIGAYNWYILRLIHYIYIWKEGQRSSLCVRKWSQASKLCFCEVGPKECWKHTGTPWNTYCLILMSFFQLCIIAAFAEFFPCSQISISFSWGLFILRSLGFHLKPTNIWGAPKMRVAPNHPALEHFSSETGDLGIPND